ncbi:hypothetical protein [Leptolyngbya ohadii]|uniref:hypothetical protein n=1 Tax=Leptolyngbya ohadii TaxID=1962290 RepID=UPI000B59E031|nr:hypothetical protein [Leptolyngbya ohadii]
MELKSFTAKTIEVAAAGGAGLFAASALSLTISGAALFAASPFVTDSIESAIGQWMFKSGIVAGVGGLVHFACWEVYINLATPRRRSNEEELLPLIPESSPPDPDADDQDWDLGALLQMPDEVADTPSICLDCQHLNWDLFSESDQHCLVRDFPEHPDFCPDWQSSGEV